MNYFSTNFEEQYERTDAALTHGWFRDKRLVVLDAMRFTANGDERERWVKVVYPPTRKGWQAAWSLARQLFHSNVARPAVIKHSFIVAHNLAFLTTGGMAYIPVNAPPTITPCDPQYEPEDVPAAAPVSTAPLALPAPRYEANTPPTEGQRDGWKPFGTSAAPTHCDLYEDRRDDWRPMPRPAAMVGLIIIGATLLPGLAALALPSSADTVPVLYQSEVERLSIMGWLRDTVAALIGWIAGTISEMTPADFFLFLIGISAAGLTSCLFAFHWVEKIGQNKEAERWARSRREIDSL